jgi:serine/threonine-protein kinase
MSEAGHWQSVRGLFDAVCDLPEARWRPALHELCDDPATIDETLQLLRAQTADLGGIEQALAAVMAAMDDPAALVGQRLGPWRLSRLLAVGGMGVVFLAERADALYRREVAIKLMRRAYDPLLATRLASESQILADLQHPHIARLYDVGVAEGGQPFLVMEHVPGEPLDRACDTLDLAARLRLFVQICRAVQAAHSQSVVHCDLKPGNVLVRADGQPVLLDFGIAHLLGDAEDSAPFLTPAYASPERLAGRPASVVGDVYSLGVMLEQLLQPTPPPVRKVPADLLAVASKARATDPAERYASAEALAEDVERHLAHRPVRARRPGRWHRARLLLRRQWRASVIVALVAVMVLAFVLRLSEARHQAEQNAAAAAGIADVLVAAFDAADPGLRTGTPMTAREVLDLGARRLAHDRTVSPALRARMQAALGRAYQNLGQPLDAQTLLRDSVDGLVRTGAAPHEIADARASLALQLLSAGQEKEALASAGHALALLEQDDDPVVRLKALNARGQAQARLEQPAAAEQSFRAALALSRGGNRAPLQRGALATMANLGDLYRSQGELDKAEAILRQAMAEASREQGVQGAEYQRVLRALSSTLLNQGRIDEALALAERGFALTRQMFGAGSSYTASAEAALAGQYLDLGRYQAADQHFRNSLQTSAAVDGVDSRAYAVKQYAHGLMEEARGDYARAEQNYRAALARYRALLGPGHADTLDVEMVLARLLLRTDRTAEAQAPLQQVAALWRRELPPESPQLLVLRLVEIEWLTRAGQLAEAARALAAFGQDHPGLPPWLQLRLQMQQALLAQRRGDPAAVPLSAQLVETFTGFYGADSTATAKWRIPLAEAMYANGDAAGARAQIARARPHLQELAPTSEFLGRITVLEQRLDGGHARELAGTR